MDKFEGAHALFLYATEGIIVTNPRGIIMNSNPSAERLFGYGVGELLGKDIDVLIPNRYKKKHKVDHENYNQNPHPRAMGAGTDLFGLKKDHSEFPVEISLTPFEDEGKKYVIAFVIDNTLRKKNEESIRKQKEELVRLNIELEKRVKNRTMILEEAVAQLNNTKEELKIALLKEREMNDLKSRFVSMASHEFRTPLATILSSLSLVTKYGEKNDKEKQHKHIERIKTSINNLTDIINDVLSISKLEEGKININYESLNLKDIAEEIVREMRTITKQDQEITYVHTGTNQVNFDKKVMKHLLSNLISNAIKFSDEGKHIEVRTEVNPSSIVVSVKDQGMGISKEDQKHLFERFFRGQNASNIQGTGLGLNIVGKYVELLDGNINFISQLEKGTTFIVTLPHNHHHE